MKDDAIAQLSDQLKALTARCRNLKEGSSHINRKWSCYKRYIIMNLTKKWRVSKRTPLLPKNIISFGIAQTLTDDESACFYLFMSLYFHTSIDF